MEQVPIPQMPQHQVQQQGLPSYYNEYNYAMANWAQDMSSRDQVPAPAFPHPFYEAAQLYRQSTNLRIGAFERFSSPHDMENYFEKERQRGAEREASIRAEYYRVQAEHNDMFQQYHQPPSRP